VRSFIKQAPNYLPAINEEYLKIIENSQSNLNLNIDSLVSYIPEVLSHSFQQKTVCIKQGSVILNSQILSNNIKIVSSNCITVDNTCQLNNVLLIARKVVFKKGFKGNVHVIATDSILTEDECVFNYPSSFCVYSSEMNTEFVKGIFFGMQCKFMGGLLAVNDKTPLALMMIKLNKHFEFIGNLYSSNFADLQGSIFGTAFCQTLLLQTASGVYENHLFNCLIDPKKYHSNLVVPNWFNYKQQTCTQWF
jgi:hypothetical protein